MLSLQTIGYAQNIIFILTDDQGWADVSTPLDTLQKEAYSNYFETPNIDKLASKGMVFTEAYAPAPMCTPTRRSIQYGMTPARQRGTEFLGDFSGKGHQAIPEYLKKINPNYKCALFGKWGEVMSGTWKNQNKEINPKALGYDESDGPNTGNVTGTFYHRNMGKAQYKQNYICTPDDDPKRTLSVTNRAISFIEQQVKDKQPFYLQVNYYALHTAHQALQATMDKYKKKGMPNRKVHWGVAPMLEDLDTAIGKIIEAVDRLGITGETYICLSSDNGGERRYDNVLATVNKTVRGRNYPLRGYKGQLYEGGIRVPFMVSGPDIRSGSVCRAPIALYDLLPTFYELVGGRDKLPKDIDGRSIVNVFKLPEAEINERPEHGLIFHRPIKKKQSALRLGNYKLVLTWSGPWEIKKTELFDLDKDIGETQNLVSMLPDKTKLLKNYLIEYLKGVNAEVSKKEN